MLCYLQGMVYIMLPAGSCIRLFSQLVIVRCTCFYCSILGYNILAFATGAIVVVLQFNGRHIRLHLSVFSPEHQQC